MSNVFNYVWFCRSIKLNVIMFEFELQLPVYEKGVNKKIESKIGSLQNLSHKPRGGDVKIFDDKKYLQLAKGSHPVGVKINSSSDKGGNFSSHFGSSEKI